MASHRFPPTKPALSGSFSSASRQPRRRTKIDHQGAALLAIRAVMVVCTLTLHGHPRPGESPRLPGETQRPNLVPLALQDLRSVSDQ